jgi:hypothetical protein
VIKRSSHQQIDVLIADLASPRAATRESAIARLTVIGARAVERLDQVAVDARTSPPVRVAALKALESIGDPRSVLVATRLIDDSSEDIAIAAISVARAFLPTSESADIVDRLATLALNRKKPPAVRLAAIGALSELRPQTIKPLFEKLKTDPDAAVAAAVHRGRSWQRIARTASEDGAERLEAIDGEPAKLRAILIDSAERIPISTLHQLIQGLRDREESEPAGRRNDLIAARAAAHAALARQKSRVALYDIRETLEKAERPLPIDFLAALETIGDAQSLEAIAAAYARASKAPRRDDVWMRQLRVTFQAIAARDKITGRHAVMKKVQHRWPESAAMLTRGAPRKQSK